MSIDSPETSAEAPLASPAKPPEASTSVGRISRPAGVTRQFFWSYLGGFIAVHLLALLAFFPWLFSWTGVISVFVGNFVFGALGINLVYHRLLTHQGLKLPKWLEHTLAVFGVCCLQDAPARWVAIHRMHHQHSDTEPDPHSPLAGFFWGHIGWLVYQNKYFGTPDF